MSVPGLYTVETSGFLNTQGVYALQLDLLAPDAPRAAFQIGPPTGVAPHSVSIVNTSRNATRFAWDFGDGARSDQPAPSHTYTVGGRFKVTLSACAAGGCDEALAVIVVEADDGGVVPGDAAIANRLDYDDDIDRFSFSAPAGAEVTIDLEAVEGVFDALLVLFGPDGGIVTRDDDGGAGRNARIANAILGEGGDYAIDTQAFPGSGFGDYRLTVRIEPEPRIRARVDFAATALVAPVTVTFRDASLGGQPRTAGSLTGRTPARGLR